MQLLLRILWSRRCRRRSFELGRPTFNPSMVLMIEFKDFSILSWNVCGFANKRSHHHMHELVQSFKPKLVFVFETHTQFATVERFWDRVSYSLIALEEAHGHSGGIWALRRVGSSFTYQLVDSMHQCITISVSNQARVWVCSVVYASLTHSVCRQFWRYLEGVRPIIMHPWALLGDFNEILSPLEQRGGEFLHSKAELFASTIDNCNLVDLDFFGGKFTWQKRCRGGTMISRRLDRGLGDLPWRMQFPEATVEHLIRRHSDHHPLLMRCSPVASSSVDRPFRFQAAWCTHSEYPTVV